MHAFGHDMHITAALGAASLLAEHRDAWTGTYLALFQPGEETSWSADAMVKDGLVDKIPKPDVALGQLVLTVPAVGKVGTTAGPMLSTGACLRVKVFGKGAHGSMPHLGVDPVLLASSIVIRLQGIVSREVNPFQMGVVTVGSVQAGTKANIIPPDATLLINIHRHLGRGIHHDPGHAREQGREPTQGLRHRRIDLVHHRDARPYDHVALGDC